ncbi:MAG: peptide deformylase [Candidatus Saganbacteria bacterium]|nr:peptide deformylase [Candidatus Saganbacteria bacterium]
MQRKIVRFPNPLLAKKSKAATRVTPEIVRLIADMFEVMYAAPGVGLAAPQVGELIRVIVADPGDNPIALINPRIVKKQGKQTYTEGCLSLPGIEAPVERAAQIVIKGLDKAGKSITISAKGLLATILQHEVDHLDGHVLIDRVKDPSLIRHMAFEDEKKEELL